MFAFVSQAASFYACDSYDSQTLTCTAWEVVPAPALLPALSTADANSIAVAMVTIFVSAWCWRFIGGFIDDYRRD